MLISLGSCIYINAVGGARSVFSFPSSPFLRATLNQFADDMLDGEIIWFLSRYNLFLLCAALGLVFPSKTSKLSFLNMGKHVWFLSILLLHRAKVI